MYIYFNLAFAVLFHCDIQPPNSIDVETVHSIDRVLRIQTHYECSIKLLGVAVTFISSHPHDIAPESMVPG